MKSVLIAGMTIVNFALISYTIAIVTLSRKKLMSQKVLLFLTVGVIFDVTATICMIIGSSQGALTPHGIIGYTSLAAMLTDTVLSYRYNKTCGDKVEVSRKFISASQIAFGYWIVAYITGALIIMLR